MNFSLLNRGAEVRRGVAPLILRVRGLIYFRGVSSSNRFLRLRIGAKARLQRRRVGP